MGAKPFLPLLAAAAIAVSIAFAPRCAMSSDCTRDSTGLVPLTDLGPSTYLGVPGGLYPSGANRRPEAHTAAGVSIANEIMPLDTWEFQIPTGESFSSRLE